MCIKSEPFSFSHSGAPSSSSFSPVPTHSKLSYHKAAEHTRRVLSLAETEAVKLGASGFLDLVRNLSLEALKCV